MKSAETANEPSSFCVHTPVHKVDKSVSEPYDKT